MPDRLDDVTETFLAREARATMIGHYQPMIVPGPLQTTEYTVLVAEARGEDPDRFIQSRQLRARALAGRPRLCVLDEAVIRRHAGVHRDPRIMPRQLHHIADLTEQDRALTVKVVPFTAGLMPCGPFVVANADGGVVYLEADDPAASVTLTAADQVAAYRDRLATLAAGALTARASVRLLREVALELDPTGGDR